jgi:hypothetical protein
MDLESTYRQAVEQMEREILEGIPVVPPAGAPQYGPSPLAATYAVWRLGQEIMAAIDTRGHQYDWQEWDDRSE